MTIVGLLMLVVFGFFAIRHFRNGRTFWGIMASIGSLLGAASLWVDYQRANPDAEQPSTVQPQPTPTSTSAEPAPVIGDYDPDADYSDSGESASSEPGEDAS